MSYVLDDIDCHILRLLQEDARLSNKQLAHRLHRSANPIYLRVKRLQDEGYIKRYTVIVDPKKIGRGLVAYTQVQLKEHSLDALLTFQLEVIKLSEVMECYHMSGEFDFLLRIAIKDMDQYNELLIKKLSKLQDLGMVQTFFVLSEAKRETAYDISMNSVSPESK